MRYETADSIDRVRDRFRFALADHILQDERLGRIVSEVQSTSQEETDELQEQQRKADAATERYNAARTQYVNAIFSRMNS
jgi:hypothetical protein